MEEILLKGERKYGVRWWSNNLNDEKEARLQSSAKRIEKGLESAVDLSAPRSILDD